MEDWLGASVWRVGRTDRLMYGRSIKAATSVRKGISEREEEVWAKLLWWMANGVKSTPDSEPWHVS